MIQPFVDAFMAAKPALEKAFAAKHPKDYGEIVQAVVDVVLTEETIPDDYPVKVHEIDLDKDYQGESLYVIAGYPGDRRCWAVKIYYGSCTGCDTLKRIRGSDYDLDDNDEGVYPPPTPQQVQDYMTLALHIVQGLVEIKFEEAL